MNTIQEQITHWTSERGPLVTRMTELLQPDRTMSDVETKTYDDLAGRVASIDDQVSRLHVLESANIKAATPIVNPAPATITKSVTPIRVTPNVPPGRAFVRMACALVVNDGNKMQAAQYAERWKDSTPEVALYLKAAVAAGNTTDAARAGTWRR